jgi:8-oxo-dGTP pyrophosphatase MutT (NUDIX family)
MNEERRERREPEKEGVIFLIYKDGKVLLEERINPDKAYFGYTLIPGGKFDKGKDRNYDDAVRREVREECGVVITEMHLLDSFMQTSITNHLYRISSYLILGVDGEITNVEGNSKHIWVELNEAFSRVAFADTKYTLLLAKQWLSATKQLGD